MRFFCVSADDDEAGNYHDDEEGNEDEMVNDAYFSGQTRESEGFKTSLIKQSPILMPNSPPVVDSTSQLAAGPSSGQIMESSSVQNIPPPTSTSAQATTSNMSQNTSPFPLTPSRAPSASENIATEVN